MPAPVTRIVFSPHARDLLWHPASPVDERHPIDPVDVNGINKTAGEWYHLLYGRVYGLPITVLRLTNTYGPRMRVRDARQTFLGLWIRQALAGEELLVFGDGTQRRDFAYADDVVRALCLAVTSPEAIGHVFNVGGAPHVSLEEAARLVVRLAGSGGYRFVPFPEDRRSIDIGDYYADDTKLRGTLGWAPEVGLEEGLAATLDYYREHGGRRGGRNVHSSISAAGMVSAPSWPGRRGGRRRQPVRRPRVEASNEFAGCGARGAVEVASGTDG
jgi:nucleoside-diphosphate-sugar epimerase